MTCSPTEPNPRTRLKPMKAIRFHEHGGPEVLSFEQVPEPSAGPGEAVVRLEAVGLNYIDTYHRSGLYPVDLPCVPGMEGAGNRPSPWEKAWREWPPGTASAGAGVQGAYARTGRGAPPDQLVPLPARIEPADAAAVLLQGMTAHYLTTGTYPLQEGDTALVHAAAGGVGLLLVQMAQDEGRPASWPPSPRRRRRSWPAPPGRTRSSATRRPTSGKRCSASPEAPESRSSTTRWGRRLFDRSLDSLKPRGTMVLFGQSSGTRASHRSPGSEPEGVALPDAADHGPTTPSRGRSCSIAPVRCWTGPPGAGSTSGSEPATSWPTPPRPTAPWRGAGPRARSLLLP